MANEAGIEFDLFDVAEIFKSTPYIADLKPGGKYVAKDMYEAGGVYMLMKTMLADNGFLDGDCMTVTGKTLGENIDEVTWNPTRRSSMTSRRRSRRPAAWSACAAASRPKGRS
jgi:dihydroxy-acid dehydratase